MGKLLAECELGINTINKMYKGTDILTLNFAKIADHLGCSADYLLGRTDNPEINAGKSVVNNGSISGNVGTKATINVSGGSERVLSDECAELLRLYESLDFRRRVQVLNFAIGVADEASESEKE